MFFKKMERRLFTKTALMILRKYIPGAAITDPSCLVIGKCVPGWL
jgi:hypothetical protein